MQEGDFEMKHIDRAGSQSFNVSIAPFLLSILGDDSDAFWELNCLHHLGETKESHSDPEKSLKIKSVYILQYV